jgi:hypothetical protein
MKTHWIKVLGVVPLMIVSIIFAPIVSAQKGVGLPPAGEYRFTSSSVDFSGFANNVQLYLTVGKNTDQSEPKVGPETSSKDIELDLSLYDYNTFTFTSTCLILGPSDFAVDQALSKATLNTTVGPTTTTCPYASPLTDTMTFTGTWTGVGPLSTTRDAATYSCLKYGFESSNRNLFNLGTANLNVTTGGVTTAYSSAQIGIYSNDGQVEASGTQDPGCGPAGLFSPLMPAGRYHDYGLNGFAFFGSPPNDQISLMEINNVSNPLGGPSTTQHENDLNLSLFDGTFYGNGCWAIAPTDITSTGLATASVQSTITGSTSICTGSYPGFGFNLPLTVNVTWTASGPLVQLHDVQTYTCQGYTQRTTNSVQSVGASSAATVSGTDYFGNPVTDSLAGGLGSIAYNDQKITATGVDSQACMTRA